MNFTEKWLRWVLDFIQMDLSGLSRPEKYRLFREVVYYASDQFFFTSWELAEKCISFSHNKFIELDGKPIDRTQKKEDQKESPKGIASEIQTALKNFFNVMTTTHGPYQLPDLSAFTRSEGIWPPSSKDHRVYFQLTFHPIDPTLKNWAIVNFAKLINGVEMHVLGKCPECGKWFLNFSLRKRKYCSHNCGAKHLFRSRKERWEPERLEAYRKKKRKIMKERYIKKRETQGKKYRPRPKKRGSKKIPKMM